MRVGIAAACALAALVIASLLLRAPGRVPRPVTVSPTGPPIPLPDQILFVRAGPGEIMLPGEQVFLAGSRIGVLRPGGRIAWLLKPSGPVLRPSWSPDGQQIVFSMEPARQRPMPLFNLFVMNSDGSGLRRLTTCRVSSCSGDVDPTWSPDGKSVAFLRDNALYLVGTDGRGLVRLRRSFGALTGGLSWSPDGTRMAVAALVGGTEQILVGRSGGWGFKPVTRCPPPGCDAPAWSPDGNQLAFVIRREGFGGEIAVISADGSGERVLTACPERCGYADSVPSWSPDGRWVIFARGGDYGGDLYAVLSAGGQPHELTSGPAFDSYPSVRP